MRSACLEPSSRSSVFYASVSRSFGLCFCAGSRRSVLFFYEREKRSPARCILLEKTFAHPIPSHSLHLYTHLHAHTQKHKGIGMFRRRFDWLFTLHANGGFGRVGGVCVPVRDASEEFHFRRVSVAILRARRDSRVCTG